MFRYDEHTRRAQVVRIIDGDTLVLRIDLGFYTYIETAVRLLGVDTPEKNSRDQMERLAAHEATEWVRAWCKDYPVDVEWPLVIRTEKAGKYGRWLADIWKVGDPESLTESLLSESLGKPYPA